MVSLTAGSETIGFLTYYFRKTKKHKGFNSVVITTLMKPLVFYHSIIENVENTMVSINFVNTNLMKPLCFQRF